MNDYFYFYVLKSEKDGKKYTGYTTNLAQRFKSHHKGNVSSTKNSKMNIGNRLRSYLYDTPL